MNGVPEIIPPVTTRFAPSPNGSLHLGHAYSAIVAHDIAKAANGTFLLRIEDIDGPRSRPELADEFRRDLEWLGLEWFDVPAQSSRLAKYEAAIELLRQDGLIYPCACTRQQFAKSQRRLGNDGQSYPGPCEGLCGAQEASYDGASALRLDVDKAMEVVGEVVWTDEYAGNVIADPRDFGDVILVRKDLPASYHLAVTLDDAADGVTMVTRGRDLLETTPIHRVLQELLKLPVPHWLHHPLVLDETGEKLAKRRNSPPLSARRESGEDGRILAEQLRNGTFGLELSEKPSI